MHRSVFSARVLLLLSAVTMSLAGPALAADEPRDPSADRLPLLEGAGLPRPSVIVVGFTGGLERHDSAISGVVRLRHAVSAHLGDAPEVATLTYNNFNWRQAARDVSSLVALSREAQAGRALRPPPATDLPPQAPGRPAGAGQVTVRDDGDGTARLPQPVIVAYGHSWGGGAIAKFARALGEDDLEIALAIYIDAFTLRNPRLPASIRYAVNFYQRTGLLRGLPLRGKRQLVPESPDATTVIGSFRINPKTAHFGWHWNLVQPLLYRHHHRISHDVRLQRYLIEIVTRQLQLLSAERESPPSGRIVAESAL